MISILFLSADPTDTARLRLGEEAREIEEKIRMSRWRDEINFYLRLSVRPQDLSQAMLDLEPQIVHFSGHGNNQGALYVENSSGRAQPIAAEALDALFEEFSDQLNCVILNACYSAVQAKAIARHIPYVIGMSHQVSDMAAVAFSIGFYQALGAGRSIDRAFRLGVAQIRIQGIPDHLIPVMVGSHQAAVTERPINPVSPGRITRETDSGDMMNRLTEAVEKARKTSKPSRVDSQLESKLYAIMGEFGVEPEQLDPDARFVEDLELDSLDVVELVMAIEDQFGIEIPDEEIANIATVGDGMDYIQRKLRHR